MRTLRWAAEGDCEEPDLPERLPDMHATSKKTSLLILGITALVCSRTLFFLFDDPEGPNLLVVTVLAVILYSASLMVYSFVPATAGLKKLLLAFCTQIVIVAGLYAFS